MTKAQARELVYKRMDDNYNTTPYTFENESFSPPVDSAWVRFTVRENSSFQQTLGIVTNRKFERGGAIYIDVFTPSDQGTYESDTIIDELRTLFEGVTFSGIRCYNALAQEIGVSSDDTWYHQNLKIFYNYDQIK